MINVAEWSLWSLIVAFALSAGAVWIAGTRLSRYADGIAQVTGLGHALLGMILLGGITSLPEIAVTVTASISGNAALAVNNLLGGFTMQVAVLALADIAVRKGALTQAVPNPIVLLQGIMGMLLIALVVMGIAVGDISFAGAGMWTWGAGALFVYAIRTVSRAEGNPAWQVIGEPPSSEINHDQSEVDMSLPALCAATAIAGAVILTMGYVLSTTGEALAERTGLGDSFFGAVFVAISTSLPEISTVLAAVSLGRYVMAVSDIFGTNLFDIGIILLVDLFYPGGAVLNEVGGFSIAAGMLGILVTGIYVVGIIERRDVRISGVGVDTILVAGTYLGGVALLYTMR